MRLACEKSHRLAVLVAGEGFRVLACRVLMGGGGWVLARGVDCVDGEPHGGYSVEASVGCGRRVVGAGESVDAFPYWRVHVFLR